jgi:16S rRNA (guanine527-N7)-methyltransferase
MREYLLNGLEKLGIQLDIEKVENLLKYAELLMEANRETNLTAIRDEETMIEKHFLDSAILQNLMKNDIESAIDIGTGAGFPGMVLAIMNPEVKFTLMDSVGKKTNFLEMVAEKLALDNVTVVNSRAEDYIKKDGKRESFDLGFCRGVSKLNIILEYMIPFLKVGGYFMAQKMEYKGEVEDAQNALIELKSEIVNIHKSKLPFCEDDRVVIEILKTGNTDKKYPRRTGIPTKRPL